MTRLEHIRTEGRRQAKAAKWQARAAQAEAAERMAPIRETLRGRAETAREAAGPALHSAKDRLVEDVLPRMQDAAVHARAAAEPYAEEAARRGAGAVAALRGEVEPPPTRRTRQARRFLMWTGLAGLTGACWAALRRWTAEPAWVSSDAFTPALTPVSPTPPTAEAPLPGGPRPMRAEAISDDLARAEAEAEITESGGTPTRFR